MADLLIPLLLFFAILGGVLIWALVRQLRELDGGSDRPFGGWGEGGPEPELPWRREKADRPASGQGQRQASSGRPTLPWQRREGQRQPDRPRPAPQPTRATPAPEATRAEPMPQPAGPELGAEPARREPAPKPVRSGPALPWRGGEQPARRRARRPRQPAWLTLPGQQRGEDAPQERPRPASQPQPRVEQEVAPDRPAPLWRGRSETPEERPAAAPSSARCSTCGGTGAAIVSQPGGGLGRGPCPVCQS